MRNILILFLFLTQFCSAEYRIYWVDIWNAGLRTQAEADAMLAAAAQSKANAVFIQIRGEGQAYFLNRIEPLPQPCADIHQPHLLMRADPVLRFDPRRDLVAKCPRLVERP